MTVARSLRWRLAAACAASALLAAAPAAGATLTADRAVAIALERSASAIDAAAGVLDARGSLYSAWGGLLPSLSGTLTHSASRTEKIRGRFTLIGDELVAVPPFDAGESSTTPSVGVTWNVGNLSSWAGWAAARDGLVAARRRQEATRSEVALRTRRQFYEVVQAIQLAAVADGAVRLARDDERRVQVMFEVGSVSKSDLLKARVRAAQSELEQLTARHLVTVQRNALASLIGVAEEQLGEVDTTLTVQPGEFDEASVLAEARERRPDLLAAAAEERSARTAHLAARLGRLPYVTASGARSFDPTSETTTELAGFFKDTRKGGSDGTLSAAVTLRWDVFNLAAVDARIAGARARRDRAAEAHAALERNLAGEVRQALQTYREAVERHEVSRRALESATENLKLTQEKYNVGAATILELIDAQVQLQRAQSDGVSARAAIRVAEAQVNRVRGRGE